MDPLRIALRALFAYVLLLVFIRLGGKRTVAHAHPFDFTVALILGDMVDDMILGEIAGSEFVVGAGIVFSLHLGFDLVRYRSRVRAQ